MINILKTSDKLLLSYISEQYGSGWIDKKLREEGQVTIIRTFTFRSGNLCGEISDEEARDDEFSSRDFILGVSEGKYYRIDRSILGLKHDLMLAKEMPINQKTFVAERNISVFRKIDDLVDEPIIIGGEDIENSIPFEEFQELLDNFPTSTEMMHYSRARVSRVLKDYFETMTDAQRKLENYLKKKTIIESASPIEPLLDYEVQKYVYIRGSIEKMLEDAEAYSEKKWQDRIVEFLLLLFPKYIKVLRELQVKDYYSKSTETKKRYLDLALVDVNGTIDIVEIKKPFANSLLSRGKYRESYYPRKELSGAVMQVEKYLFHLTKWGREGEREIQKKRRSELPGGLEIKITNPKAMIILGRDSDFANDQRFDFEIMRRKYANVTDIMTYDDLLRRLNSTIEMIQRRCSAAGREKNTM
ncbi:DUF4263 domain-containing protein [bacterium]|nr:DUF4263 domain-containing protein [candidate division CSSED10-310 bacterium]